MLQNLHVKNLALIDEADVEFGEGLNILSGETGAGKSIIIGSINIALGEKAPKDILRKNAEFALIELTFEIKNKDTIKHLKSLGVEIGDDNLVVISKKIKLNRTVSRINGETVSASKIQEISSFLIDIHGQHEHQSLLNKKKHLQILDEFAKRRITGIKEELSEAFLSYRKLIVERQNANMNSEERNRELSFLEFEVNEIEEANLKENEDEELEEKYRFFSNGKKIIEKLNSVREITNGEIDGVAELLDKAMYDIQFVVNYDEKIQNLTNELSEIESLVNDFNYELSNYISELDFDEHEFYELDSRLNLINTLKAKYGRTISDILESYEEKKKRIQVLQEYDEYINQLEKNINKEKEKLDKLCMELSSIRKEASVELVDKIKAALLDLNFLDVKFEMNFGRTKDYTSDGFDDVEFLISTNPGEPVRPLQDVASGGELSRIMLAIKTIMAQDDDIETLIFDEIDTGISGRTAQMVSEKMDLLSQLHQIICITHLPQIAAMANHHYLIEKSIETDSEKNEMTVSRIHSLNYDQSVKELARMIGGVEITEKVIESAREMKGLAKDKKKSR
ncbi:DNA repair protein RecN [Lachnobacterium bovis]|uniref:DNA repair protein RecN n=1 Tax=Lachnobacterium bovis TaxID=140626 RepID=A0A1H9PUE0_9FIRM|nr:DNA repair protein RecN [Lachnobacterium bovis]SER51782.1 DNA repair protein RecN (Recombination protein N) [Lachnobacterium bovis]